MERCIGPIRKINYFLKTNDKFIHLNRKFSHSISVQLVQVTLEY